MCYEVVFADENGTVKKFEQWIMHKYQQAAQVGRGRAWIRLAELYFKQKERLKHYPYPEDFNDKSPEDEHPPIIKKVDRNTQLELLFRWGFKVAGTEGNHRILYTIHNYEKVVLLHHFDKRYNHTIRREDIIPAEEAYFKFMEKEPSLYPVMRG
jgi:mRNA-degrading endonuclease RelE of RelBE toxin-antitoxin system